LHHGLPLYLCVPYFSRLIALRLFGLFLFASDGCKKAVRHLSADCCGRDGKQCLNLFGRQGKKAGEGSG